MSKTSERLKELRLKKDVSQADVAKAIGITRTAYVKYETGVSKPVRKLHELANYFNVSTDYLLGNESSMRYVSSPRDDSESTLLSGYRNLNDLGKQTILSLIGQLTGGQSVGSGVIKGNITGNNGYVNVGGVHMTGTAI